MNDNGWALINEDTGKLTLAANQLGQTAESIETSAAKLDQITSDIQCAWKSEYTAFYLEGVEQVQGELEKISRNIILLSECIFQLIEDVRQAETDNKVKFNT